MSATPQPSPQPAGDVVKYRKRPVVIEAIQLDGSEDAWNAAIKFVGGASGAFNGCLADDHPDRCWFYIDTLEGQMTAKNGDWIIKGVQGEFYPCNPDIFAATYEPAETARAIQDGKGATPADIEQQARELFARELERDGVEFLPGEIRKPNSMLTVFEDRTIRAIKAALAGSQGEVVGEAISANDHAMMLVARCLDMNAESWEYRFDGVTDASKQAGDWTVIVSCHDIAPHDKLEGQA